MRQATSSSSSIFRVVDALSYASALPEKLNWGHPEAKIAECKVVTTKLRDLFFADLLLMLSTELRQLLLLRLCLSDGNSLARSDQTHHSNEGMLSNRIQT